MARLLGLVLDKFYAWFVEPVYTVQPISYIQAVGLSVFISLFKLQTKREVEESQLEPWSHTIISSVLLPWTTLLTGYIIYTTIY